MKTGQMAAVEEYPLGATLDAAAFRRDVVERCRPVILRGLVRHWPAIAAASDSPAAFMRYLAPLDAGLEMEAFVGAPRIAGKYYYDDALTGFNFERRRMRVAEALAAMLAGLDSADTESVYVGSL